MRAKKLLSVLLAGAMMMSVLAGCGGSGIDVDEEIKSSDVQWSDDNQETAKEAKVTLPADGTIKVVYPETVKENQVTVGSDGTVIFTVTAEKDKLVKDIKVGGQSIMDEEYNPVAGPVQVALTNVHSDLKITVEYVNATYNVTANVSTGGSVIVIRPAVYGGTTSATVTPDELYTVGTVTATIGGDEAKEVTAGADGKYTVSNVTGDVVFSATFNPMPITGVTVTGAPTKITYDPNSNFDVSGMTVEVTYSDGAVEKSDNLIAGTNAEVTSGPLAVGTQEVVINYTGPNGETYEIHYSLDGVVTINALGKDEVDKIKGDFGTQAGSWNNGGTLVVNNTLVGELEAAEGGTVTINGDSYEYAVLGPRDDIGQAMREFYKTGFMGLGDGTVAKLLRQGVFGGYERGTVCINVDQTTGNCTMWVIKGYTGQ